MRYLLFVLLLAPLAAPAQKLKDYKQAMATFQKFYNSGQGDSIDAMFGDEWKDYQGKKHASLWTNEENKDLLEKYGKLESYTYLGIDTDDPNKVYVFKTVFSKAGHKTTSLTLDKHNKLGTFRYITSSDGIDKLLKKKK